MKRITTVISPEEEKYVKWMMDETGCSMTDSVRIALSLAGENFNGEMILKQYINLRRRDRARREEERRKGDQA